MAQRVLFTLFLWGLVIRPGLADPEHTMTLRWQAQIFSESIPSILQEMPFAKEPDLAGHKVLRGYLSVGENRSERLGFIWDKDQGSLYLDLNRDGDLTDDPNNVWSQPQESRSSARIWHQFNDLRVALGPDANAPAVFDATLYDYGSFRQASFNLRSAYFGVADLHGQSWTLTLADTNLDGRIDRSDRFKPSNTNHSAAMPDEVFVEGTNYEIILDDFPTVTLRNKDVPMGTLDIQAKGIQTLVLEGSGRLVWIDPQTESTRIPAGQYLCIVADLALKDRQRIQPSDLGHVRVTVPENGTDRIRIGSPLHHQVQATRSGRNLNLAYELRGEGGERYDLRTLLPSSQAPTFKVYKGETVVGSGRFEFG